MGVQPSYFFTVQHPRLLKDGVVAPQTASVPAANDNDNLFTVFNFTGTDSINDGFVIEVTISVNEDLLTRLFSDLIDNFLRFLIKEQPSLLFQATALNSAGDIQFITNYEGIAINAVAQHYTPQQGSEDGYYEVDITLVSRFQAIDDIKHSYIYEDDTADITVVDSTVSPPTSTIIDFTTSPAGTQGIFLQDVLESVFEARKFVEGLDYMFEFTPVMNLNGAPQPNANLVHAAGGMKLAANYLLHSKEPDKESGLRRFTSRAKMRFQYQETDFNFVNRLCQSEGVSILYEVTEFTVVSQSIADDADDATKSILTTGYSIELSDGTIANYPLVHSVVPKATQEDPQYLFAPGTAVFRSLAVLTDFDNRSILDLSPILTTKDDQGKVIATTVLYPVVRGTPQAGISSKGVRDIFNHKSSTDLGPEVVVVANYSEQTDNIGSTVAHAPINAATWNTRAVASTGTNILSVAPTNQLPAGHGIKYYYGETVPSEADAKRMAARRMQMLKAQAHTVEVDSFIIDVRAGAAFQLFDYYYDAGNALVDRGYIYSVTLQGYNPSWYGTGTGRVAPFNQSYSNSFKYIPVNASDRLVYRPSLTTEKPKINNALQAVVATDALALDETGERYPDIDPYGRYLIRFLFDRAGRDKRSYTERSVGNRVRKASFFADGLDRSGFHFPLDKGTHVLVAFHADNPDMPILIGCLPRRYFTTYLRNMTLSQQISYLRTGSGSGVYFVDQSREERLIVETDLANSLADVTDTGVVNFDSDNYIELGLQRPSDSNADSDINFGVRKGSKGFNQMTALGGVQSIMVTADRYQAILTDVSEKRAEELAANITEDSVVNVGPGLEDLSDALFDPHLFSFRRYSTDVGGITDNLMPYAKLYRNSYSGKEKDDSEDILSKTSDTKEASDDGGEAAVENQAEIPEHSAPGSFYRVIGDSYHYRQGHDFVYGYSGTNSVAVGNVNYFFGNSIEEFYPSFNSTLRTEQEQRDSDEAAMPDFSYSNYASESDTSLPGVNVRRYMSNYVQAVEGAYEAFYMRDKVVKVDTLNAITSSFEGSFNGDIEINSDKVNLMISPSGKMSTLALVPSRRSALLSAGLASGRLAANSFEMKSMIKVRVGLGFDVVFSAVIEEAYGFYGEMNVMGDYRVWALGTRVDLMGADFRKGIKTNQLDMINFGNLYNEVTAGLVLMWTSLALSTKEGVVMIANAATTSASVSENKCSGVETIN